MFYALHSARRCGRGLHAGFTLIELLVVVLIIGILAAVALPQYRKAVARSRAAEAVAMLTTLNQAQQRYFLANGTYTSDLSLLDVQVPASTRYFRYATINSNSDGSTGSYWRSNAASLTDNLFFEFPVSTSATHWCVASSTLAQSICATYGTYSHAGFGYKYYKF